MFDDLVLAEPLFASSGTNRFSGTEALGILGQFDVRHGIGSFAMTLPETIHWSPSVFDLYGYPYADRALGLDEVLQPILPEDRLRLAELVKNAIRHKVGYHAVVRVARPTWEIRLMEVHADVVATNDKTSGLVGTVKDITETARIAARPQGDFAFVSTMASPCALLDRHMHVLACSDGWLRCFAVPSRAKAVGKSLKALSPNLAVGWSMDLERVMGGHEVKSSREFYEPSTGRKLTCEVSLFPCKDASGSVVAALASIGHSGLVLANRPRLSRPAITGMAFHSPSLRG
jgi:PAS domain S-box-containing protein